MPPTLKIFADRRIGMIFILGFVAGIPLAMIYSTLTWWLGSQGIALASIGWFAMARTPYSWKFLWAPVIDRLNLPFLSNRFGRRRGWGVPVLILLALSLMLLGQTDPNHNIYLTFTAAIMVAFLSASFDIILDALRIEILKKQEQGLGISSYTIGYRIGMLVSSAGALVLSAYVSWDMVYGAGGMLILLGIPALLMLAEPDHHNALFEVTKTQKKLKEKWRGKYGRFASLFAWIYTAVVMPFKEFLSRPSSWAILGFVLFFKVPDSYIGQMANVLYYKLQFSEIEVATIRNGIGVFATLAGIAVGGILTTRIGFFRALVFTGILQILSNLMYVWLARAGDNNAVLTATIIVENFTGGMGSAALMAYLSSLTNVAFTATQYALLSSVMIFARDLIGVTSGYLAQEVGWEAFFTLSATFGLPSLLFLLVLRNRGVLAKKDDTDSATPHNQHKKSKNRRRS